MPALIFDGPDTGPQFVFAHGAGADCHSDFIQTITHGLAQRGIRVVRFNFDYMQQRIDSGKRRPPERMPALLEQYRQVIEQLEGPLVIGGKSMGGRVASLLFSERDSDSQLVGCACLGYPFHPQGKPDSLRTEHLLELQGNCLIIQGTRDKLGNQAEVASYGLSQAIALEWLPAGDHDFKPTVASGHTQQEHLEQSCKWLSDFVKRCQ